MTPIKPKKPAPGAVRRRAATAMVEIGPYAAGRAIPLVIRPAVDGVDLAAWAKTNLALVEELRLEHRALLFRGFGIRTVEDFESVVMATSDGNRLEYRDRTTPRTTEGNRIYTATVHPADQTINPHNEGTYWVAWAKKLYFCCLQAPSRGGETPLFDVRRVHDRIDPAVRARFEAKDWMLVRNYNDGFGLPWQEVFQTDSKAEVEAFCAESKIELEWGAGDRLRTRQVRPAVRAHPETGEKVWFNHAAFYHHTTLDPEMRTALVGEFGLEGLPYNTCYGDGSPIEPDDVAAIRDAYAAEKTMFPWQQGDITLVDNMSIAHAREPFEGERKVLVSMTDAIHG